jgi:hypothetical protein
MPKTPIERVFDLLGGPAAVAKHFTGDNGKPILPWAVSKWRRRVPADRVLKLEELTGGRVTRYELRPDIYGESPKRVAA